MKSYRFLLGLVYLALCCSAFSQSTNASLTGFVDDPSKAVIPKVSITAINTQTGAKTRTFTNSSGEYVLPGLAPGDYRIEVDKQGFKGIIEAGLALHVQDVVQINFHMALGSMSETVTVNGDSVQMNTTDASVSTVVDQKLISELPMNGRSLDSLFLLTPGVVSSGTQNAGGQYSVNGQRASGNNLTVDGASGNIYVGINYTGGGIGTAQTGLAGSTYATSASGGTNGLLPVDAIEEYRIQTSTYSAEFGRSPGGQIQVRSRGGTNEFHGSIFEYFRNQVLDATDWFVKYDSLKQAPLRMNDFGGTFGGPIVKNHLFFFAAHESLLLDQPNNTTTEVPSAYARQNVSSVFAPFLAAYPNGNGGAASTAKYPQYTDIYHVEYATQITDHSTSMRFDAALPHGYSGFFRFNIAPSSSRNTVWNSTDGATTLNTYTLGIAKTLTNSLTNEATLNYSKNDASYTFSQLAINGADPSGFSNYCTTTARVAVSSAKALCQVIGLTGWGLLQQGSSISATLQQWNLVDTMRWTVQRHAIAFGIDFRRATTNVLPFSRDEIYVGSVSGASALGGNLLDKATTQASRAAKLLLPVDNLSLYIKDTWHVTSRLTVDYGVRWEYDPPISDGQGGPLAIAGNVDNPATLQPAPLYTPLYNATYRNFAPRLGMAYEARRSPNFSTVLRLGAGIFYDTGQAATTVSTSLNSYPYVLSNTESNILFSSLDFKSLQAASATKQLPQPFLYVVDPNLKLPYTGEWNFAIEQLLRKWCNISATYLGADGEKLGSTIQLYGLTPSLVSSSSLEILENAGRSNYQALQLQSTFRRSVVSGIVSYTYSHNIDNGTSDFSGPAVYAKNYRASADDDVRHVLAIGASVKSKVTGRTKLMDRLADGWIFNTLTRLQTASPLSVLNGSSLPGSLANSFTGYADTVPGIPVYLTASVGANGKRIPGGIQLNPAAFADPPATSSGFALRDGDSARNAYRLFGLREFDLSAGRMFPITEALHLEFKVEAFNIFNTANFANVVNTVGSANFGQAQNTAAGFNGGTGGGGLNTVFQSGGPRNLQLTVRMSF